MSKIKHTPTPWRLGRNGTDYCVFFGDEKFVADCEASDTDEDRANAAFIVRAVNSHQALVDALKDAERAFEFIRFALVENLDEPERSAFWKAVQLRDDIRSKLAALNLAEGVEP